MKKFYKQSTGAALAVAALLFAAGCEVPNNAPANTAANANTIAVNSAPMNTAVNTNLAAPTANREADLRIPVTLPVLDAMFSDETFADELKSKLQLSDEQIDRVKNLARTAVADLNESETDDAGSTRAATTRAAQKIRETLGEEKSAQLFEFVRARWSSGEETGNSANDSAKPNQIPTDTRIVVNAPAYRMDVFQDGKLVKSYKIGIGYPEFPLPSGVRKADTIIFNPTWTPPDEPWVKGKVEAGKTVKAGDKLNPLGPIKIPIGSPSLIHGGKSPARLGSFASHGCVGLTNQQVQDFAFELARLSGNELTAADVKNYEKQKTETKNVKLNRAIPVELRYETIVVEDGKLKIFRDVYERGTNTEENLRRVLDANGVSLDSLPEKEKILQGLQQMAYDATGNPVDADANANANANVSQNDSNKSNQNRSAKTDANKSENASVTRSVKGKKEVFFDIAALKGKGYPAALGMKQ